MLFFSFLRFKAQTLKLKTTGKEGIFVPLGPIIQVPDSLLHVLTLMHHLVFESEAM